MQISCPMIHFARTEIRSDARTIRMNTQSFNPPTPPGGMKSLQPIAQDAHASAIFCACKLNNNFF